jgi:hypothetical protein
MRRAGGGRTGKRPPDNRKQRVEPLPEAKRKEVAKKAGAARARAGKGAAAGRGRPG